MAGIADRGSRYLWMHAHTGVAWKSVFARIFLYTCSVSSPSELKDALSWLAAVTDSRDEAAGPEVFASGCASGCAWFAGEDFGSGSSSTMACLMVSINLLIWFLCHFPSEIETSTWIQHGHRRAPKAHAIVSFLTVSY